MAVVLITTFFLGVGLALAKAGEVLNRTSMGYLAEGIALCLGYPPLHKRLEGRE